MRWPIAESSILTQSMCQSFSKTRRNGVRDLPISQNVLPAKLYRRETNLAASLLRLDWSKTV